MKSTAAEWVTFRMPLWRWYVLIVVVGQLAAILFGLVLLLLDPDWLSRPANTVAAGIMLALTPAVYGPACLAYIASFRYQVGPTGLRGYDRWGRALRISWEAVQTVERFNLPPVPFLLIRSSQARWALWLPLFMADYDRFAALVAEFAGEDHPVTLELLSRLEADA